MIYILIAVRGAELIWQIGKLSYVRIMDKGKAQDECQVFVFFFLSNICRQERKEF